ncbi:hypothetical protein [Pararobbsia silviterrae]|uniref:Uncharacterized protein n=1 Tax=Pararobbsia silviterrae TaxID=1792498 RepID=A0A494XFF3_9BURK|nr:hypothetical protein [Pararobbsia silviterrae]RKP48602.1 hypothetical protein D7S86_21590 [Pararobbsia silviterrae]
MPIQSITPYSAARIQTSPGHAVSPPLDGLNVTGIHSIPSADAPMSNLSKRDTDILTRTLASGRIETMSYADYAKAFDMSPEQASGDGEPIEHGARPARSAPAELKAGRASRGEAIRIKLSEFHREVTRQDGELRCRRATGFRKLNMNEGRESRIRIAVSKTATALSIAASRSAGFSMRILGVTHSKIRCLALGLPVTEVHLCRVTLDPRDRPVGRQFLDLRFDPEGANDPIDFKTCYR